jgi:hypothetical protein
MLSLDDFTGVTRMQVIDALVARYGTRSLEWRFERLGPDNQVIGEISTILDGGISYDSDAAIKRTAKFVMSDDPVMNFLRDRIKVWARLKIPETLTSGDFPISATYDDAFDHVNQLLARWRMNDASGEIQDSVGTHHLSGTDLGYLQSTLVNDGGRSVRIPDGSSLSTEAGGFLNGLTAFTIAGWLKADLGGEDADIVSTTSGGSWADYDGQPISAWDGLAIWEVAGTSSQGQWRSFDSKTIDDIDALSFADITPPETTQLSVYTSSDLLNYNAVLNVRGKTLTVSTPANTAASAATFFAMTWRSGAPVKLYLNGELAATSDPAIQAIGGLGGIENLDLGGSGFSGLMDDWMVAGEELTSGVIYDLFASGTQLGRTSHEEHFVEWSQGVFLTSSPDRSTDDNGVCTWSVEGYDQGVVLQEQQVEEPYYVAAGALYTDAIAELLINTEGLNGFTVVPSTKTLPALKMWDTGTTHIEIINDLCTAITYDSIFFDESGVGVVRPHVAPQYRTEEWVYEEGDTSVIFADASRELDLFEVPNKWVAYISEPDRPVLRSEYINADPANPTSTVARARTITKVVDDIDAADQASLDDILRWRAQEEAQVYETVHFSTAIMPIHSHMDLYRFAYPTGLQVEGDYEESGWSYDFDAGGQMSHTARRVVVLDDYVPPENPDPDPDPDPDPGDGKSGSVQSLNNDCPNPILATNSTGWGDLGNGAWTTTRVAVADHRTANFALQINTGGLTAEPGAFLPQENPLDAGDVWTFAVDMQCTVAAQGQIAVDWYTSGGVYVSTDEGPFLDLNSDGTWKRISLTFTAPAGVGTGGRANVTAYAVMASATGIWRLTIADYVAGVAQVPDPDPTQAVVTNGRIFTRGGDRFFWIADSAWAIPIKLTREEVDDYLDDRDSKGFNVIQIAAIFPLAGGPGPNRYGAFPYSGTLNNRSDTYWQHIDYIVNAAATRGLVVAIAPCWAAGQAGSLITASNARTFGEFLGARYVTKTNVVWVLGGDKAGSGDETIWRELAAGLDSGGGATQKIQTYLPADDQASTSWFNTDSWIEFHGIQTDQALSYTAAQSVRTAAYANTGSKPWVNLYSTYEGGSRSALDARMDAYWSALGGAAGHTYGHDTIWQFATGWQTALTAEAGSDMVWLKNLLLSRPRAEPATGIVTVQGSGATYTPTAKDSGPTTSLIIYIPDGTARTVNMGVIPGTTANPYWFSPKTGVVTVLTPGSASGTRTFTPPDSNDWVLVIDDAAIGYANPGLDIDPTPPAPPADNFHGPRALSQGWVAHEVDRDDFNGTGVDTSRWGQYNSVGHGGNGLRRPSAFTVVSDATANGGKTLRCFGTSNGTTGGMAHRVGQQYGRWAARMRIPNGDSRYHPVLLTWPDAENWPVGGEIDYAEGECGVNHMNFFLHYSSSNSQTHGAINIDTTQWHWYEMEWTPTAVRGWCDGVQYFEDTNHSHSSFGAHHGTIQLDWFPEGASTTGTGEMYVDAYRVYSL